jgi:D-aspartate ligase
MSHKALVLGTNYYIGLSVLRSLKKHNVTTVAVDYDQDAAYGNRSNTVDEILIIPHYSKSAQACCDALIDYANKQSHKPVLFPCADQYVAFIDHFFDQLQPHYLFQYQTQGLATQLMNKNSFAKIAKEHGMLIPLTYTTKDTDLIEKIDAVGYPWLIKGVDSSEYVSAFRVKLHQINNQQELIAHLKLLKEKNIDAIAQQMIVGFDDHMLTYDAYLNQQHHVTHAITCQKIRQYPINYGASVMTTIVYNKKLHQIGQAFLEAIKWTGFAELEFKKDARTGELYLIEMNVRTTNFNQMLTHVGLNFPYITYRELIGDPIASNSITTNIKVAFVYGYENMLALKDYIKAGQMTAARLLEPFHYRKVPAIWSLSDPKPFFAFIYIILKKATRKLRSST